MSRLSRGVTAATGALLAVLAGGLITVGGRIGPHAAAPTSAEPVTTTAQTDAQTDSTPASASVETSLEPSTTIDGFAEGAAASEAAEELLSGYIASQHGVGVSDPACSEPPSGAVGEVFACYALKPGDLVIALRATIGEDRLVTLELITDQTTTTTTTTTVAPTTSTAG